MTKGVLVVDDSLTVRMDLVGILEKAGHPAFPAASLAAARQVLSAGDVGAVILDVNLPDGDGFQFLQEIRSSASAHLPVLMLSSEAEVKDRIHGLTTGADDYVGKPYDRKYVVAKAQELLRQSRALPAAATVLVVDDSPTFRSSLSAALRGGGFLILEAASAEDALEVLGRRRPEAILVDQVMPGMDGASLVRRIRLDAALRDTACLLLTASDDPDAELNALESGADAFVRKDGDLDVVLARLEAIMRPSWFRDTAKTRSLAGPRKILAVGGAGGVLHEASDTLRGEGYEIAFAESGKDGLELLAVQSVDLVLIELDGEADAIETCTSIKQAAPSLDVPVIVVSRAVSRDEMLAAFSVGADDFLDGSTDFAVLNAHIRAQLRRKQSLDESRRIQGEFLRREREAEAERAARRIAEARAAMVGELERTIEERTRELEIQVAERRQSERMASIGMLAASVAHEINNPLAVIAAAMTILEEGLTARLPDEPDQSAAGASPGRSELMEVLRDATVATERVRRIVADLRLFARPDDEEGAGLIDVNAVLVSSIRFASNEIRHRAKLRWSPGTIRPVLGQESRLGQVFLNLIMNAAQAIPEGHSRDSEISISTRSDESGRTVVEIADPGVGIPSDKIEQIFDPFFTTKGKSGGTGLGLPISRRIVTELGGEIAVDSSPGVGTTFKVLLPGADSPLDMKPQEAPPEQPQAAIRGRVLIVDDEPALGRMFERMLSKDHDVVLVPSASLALEKLASDASFDVILCDLMMPEMNGIDLYERLKLDLPEAAGRMLFMTGGVLSERAASFVRGMQRPPLAKPFKSSEARAAIRAMMEAAVGVS